MESETWIEFVEGDKIYGINIENQDGIVTKIIDKTKIYKIVSIDIERYGGLEKYLVRYTAVVIPENETSIKDFGECWVLQSTMDGKTNLFAVKV
jgi:hypothetical protein